ncbi:MAG TPA: hypothetical protein VEZ48_10125 [Sphingomonadaceae bacterium]|nr:hypothetical protein [Sphingomonadaceae bacterium]
MGERKRTAARVMGVAETDAFLAALRESGNVRRATAAAGLAVSAPYRRRASDGVFAAAWEAAVMAAAERAAATLAAGAHGRDRVRLQSGGKLQLTAPRARMDGRDRTRLSGRAERHRQCAGGGGRGGRVRFGRVGPTAAGAGFRRSL